MKKTIFFLLILFSLAKAQSQSAICLQFLPQKNIQTYCVDNYPLGDDDSINVTFLMADDSNAYNIMIKTLFTKSTQKQWSAFEQHYNKKNKKTKNNKCFIIRLSTALPNDKGRYLTFLSPCNMSAMVFHIKNDKDMAKVVAHVLSKETPTK